MPNMSQEELSEMLNMLELSTEENRDDLLTDFLTQTYPTKATQDN